VLNLAVEKDLLDLAAFLTTTKTSLQPPTKHNHVVDVVMDAVAAVEVPTSHIM
jgi:hypothetical protein